MKRNTTISRQYRWQKETSTVGKNVIVTFGVVEEEQANWQVIIGVYVFVEGRGSRVECKMSRVQKNRPRDSGDFNEQKTWSNFTP